MSPPAARVLARLRDARAPISGEAIAAELGISRAAVHKHVEALRAEGYRIDARHARGYVLAGTPDRLDPTEVGARRRGSWTTIDWHASIDSTQRRAHELARAGAVEGTVVFAEAQSAGRGRLGRTWHSPAGVNVYCSVILRPALVPAGVPQLALVAGLAVAAAIEEGTGLDARLKWPNDVLLGGRKVAGIITEMDAEVECVHFVVIGIGVNVNVPADAFPPDLREKATSLAIATGTPVDRVALAAAILAALEREYGRFLTGGFAAMRAEWNRRSALTGRRVTVLGPDGTLAGTVTGVAADGALELRDDGGGAHRILAGEVTIADGYGSG